MPRAERIVGIALLVLGTAYFSIATDGRGRSVRVPNADASYYYAYAPSLLLDGDLDFTNQYQITKNWYRFGPAPTGKPSNVFGIGPALFSLPVFALAHGVALATGDRADGFSVIETSAVLWLSLLASVLAILFAIRLARRHVRDGAAVAGAVIAALAGPMLYYAVRQPGYAHPFAALFVAWFVERWDASFTAPRTWKTWAVLGVLWGCAALARPQLVLWGVILAPCAVDDFMQRAAPFRVLVGRCALAAVCALLVFSPQLLAWKAIYGAYYLVPQGPGFMRWDSPCVIEALFSSRNGLFAWAPLYLVFLFAACRRRWLVLLIAFALQAIVNGAAWDWWAGGSFGGRRFDSTYVIAALGAAVVCDKLAGGLRARAWKRYPAALGALAVLAVAYGEVVLALHRSVVSVNLRPGVEMTNVWWGAWGEPAALLAEAEMFPAAAGFALRYGVPLDAYEQLQGVYSLGDRYPGLNAIPDQLVDIVRFGDLSSPRFAGLVPAGPHRAAAPTGHARILIGLNRRGAIRVTVPSSASNATVSWNGVAMASASDFTTADLRRGINVLEISSPAPFEMGEVSLAVILAGTATASGR